MITPPSSFTHFLIVPPFALLFASVVAVMTAVSVYAQGYPVKPIRLILPYPPGGSTDIMGRIAAEILSKAWSVQVIADNRPGAAGNIGVGLCARSPADGYTMCTLSVAQSIAPSIYRELPFDPITDFSHVSLLAFLPSLLVVHPSLPAKSVREIIALAKAKPGAMNYSSTGNGSTTHMLMEMFKLQAGINIVHIPYKGTAPAMLDLISGQVQVSFSAAISTLPFVSQGKLRAIAVSTKERYPTLPDLPTVDESGLRGFDGVSWQGLSMPAGVPRDIVNRVNAELSKALNSPAMKERIIGMGGLVSSYKSEEFSAFVKAELDKWARVAKEAKVTGG